MCTDTRWVSVGPSPGEDNSRTAISSSTKRSNTDSGAGYAALTILRSTDAFVRHGDLRHVSDS